MPVTFVVSTGRSGSTMLSKILRLHPDVLSMSEFFVSLQRVPFRWELPTQPMDGATLWELMTGSDMVSDAMILAGLKNDEMLYDYDSGRFSAATGVPCICHSTLPILSDDPDSLYDEMERVVPGWPVRPAADQIMHLFEFLAKLLGRRVIVERSGLSLALIDQLQEQFPGSRFVHMYRDGVDCTLSMLRHPLYRFAGLYALLANEAGLTSLAPLAEIAEALPGKAPGLIMPPFDAQAFMAYDIPPALYARTWSALVASGIESLAKLPPDAWTQLGYEQLLADPRTELTRLAAFLGVPATQDWLAASAAMIDPLRIGASERLEPELLAQLRAACARGEQALASVSADTATDTATDTAADAGRASTVVTTSPVG